MDIGGDMEDHGGMGAGLDWVTVVGGFMADTVDLADTEDMADMVDMGVATEDTGTWMITTDD
jgi:hypothetical protein